MSRPLGSFERQMLAMVTDPTQDDLTRVLACVVTANAVLKVDDETAVHLVGLAIEHWQPRPEAAA